MPDPLQYWQYPGVILVGLMAVAALVVLVLRGVNEQESLAAQEVRRVCLGVTVTSTVLIMVFGATAPGNPTKTSISSWFALVALVAGLTALFLIYKVWDDRRHTWAIDATLLGITAMAYFTLACELFLVGRYDTGRWTGLIRKLPVAPLWVAAVLILVLLVLLVWDRVLVYLASRKKRAPQERKPSQG